MDNNARVCATGNLKVSLYHQFESWWGAFCAALIFCGLGFICVAVGVEAVVGSGVTTLLYRLALTLLPALVIRLSVPALWAVWKTLWLRRYPVPPNAALTQLLPAYLRPIACLWWLIHFCAAGMLAFSLHGTVSSVSAHPVGNSIVGAILIFGMVYGSNIFLLLAATALGFGEAAIGRIWRARIVIDILLTMVPFLFMVVHH